MQPYNLVDNVSGKNTTVCSVFFGDYNSHDVIGLGGALEFNLLREEMPEGLVKVKTPTA